MEFIYKKLCIYSYMFKLKSTLKDSPVAFEYNYQEFFPAAQKQFWNSSILMPFGASVVFCFTSATSAKFFPLRTFFTQVNKPKKSLGVILGD